MVHAEPLGIDGFSCKGGDHVAERFFSARAWYYSRRSELERGLGLSDGISSIEEKDAVQVETPKGFESVAFFSRLCKSGMITWADIKAGKVSVRDCYEIALMIDLDELCNKKARLELQGREQ